MFKQKGGEIVGEEVSRRKEEKWWQGKRPWSWKRQRSGWQTNKEEVEV